MVDGAGTGAEGDVKKLSDKVAKLTEMMAAANKEKYDMGKKLMEQKKTKKALEAQIEALTAGVASLQEQNATFSSQVEMAQGAAAVVEGADSKLVEAMAENRKLQMEKMGMQSEYTRVKGELELANTKLKQSTEVSSGAVELQREKDEAMKNMEVLNIRVESEIAALKAQHKADRDDLTAKLLQEQQAREHMREDLRRLSEIARQHDELQKEVETRRKVQGECKYCSLSIYNANRDDLERAGNEESPVPKMSAFKAAMRRKILPATD